MDRIHDPWECLSFERDFAYLETGWLALVNVNAFPYNTNNILIGFFLFLEVRYA